MLIIDSIILFLKEFLLLTNEMSPYLLLGLLLAGILHVYFKKDVTKKYLGKPNLKSVVYAALLGVPLPLCSCGVIPTGIAFYKEGASKGATVSFLISTPQTGVDSIAVTWSMMSLPFALLRPVVAFITGIVGGVITNKMKIGEISDSLPEDDCNGSCHVQESKSAGKFKTMLQYAFIEFLDDIAKWLTIGLLIAALISVLIPDDFFIQYLGNPVLSMLVVLLISVPMYICATGSVPIAVVLMAKGLSPGAALVFLMAGPATNAATITVLGKVLGRKTLLVYIATISLGAVLFGLIIDYLLPARWFALAGGHLQHIHNMQQLDLFSTLCSVILALLLLSSFIRKLKSKFMNISLDLSSDLTVGIDGMTCNHCKTNVEKAISSVEGVESVTVDLQSATATIKGKHVSAEIIKTVVEDRGYIFKGVK